MELTTVYDCMGANLGKFPVPLSVLLAGYATGSGAVPWTVQQWDEHPDAIRFDQWPAPTPAGSTADVIDVEQGAVPIAQVPERVHAAQANFRSYTRPGQRWPAVYVEDSEKTPVANALVAAGLTHSVPLFLTKPMTETEAAHILNTTGGPFPFIGVQYGFHGLYDVSLVSTAWLNNRSKKPGTTSPSGQYEVQVERWQHGFGWVLETTLRTKPGDKFRARVFNGKWSDWQEIGV